MSQETRVSITHSWEQGAFYYGRHDNLLKMSFGLLHSRGHWSFAHWLFLLEMLYRSRLTPADARNRPEFHSA